MGALRRGEPGFRVVRRQNLAQSSLLAPLRLVRRHLLLSAVLGSAAALLSAAPSVAEGPTIEAAGGAYGGYYWSPSSAEVGGGGAVAFRSASATVPHGVTWTGGPETPSCSGVPIDEGRTSWSGSCTFTQPGTYAFRCYVHPTEMTGTITVSSSGTVTTSPPPPPAESPLNGPAAQALELARAQRGSVRGSIELSQAAAGGRLEVDLVARRSALLGAGHRGTMRVGRLLRSYLRAGRASFAVPLKPPARRALRRHKRLALTVTVIVTPLEGEAVKLRRAVVIHA